MEQKDRIIKNEDLQEVINIAKSKGYKVYTYENDNKYITSVTIEDTSGRIGYCEVYFSGIKFSTIHKINRGSGLGTGFGGLIKGEDFNNPKDLDICFVTYPYWSIGANKKVEKYKSFEEYRNTPIINILKYFEL